MLFSIVMAVYNVEEYLNDCIESILRQKFKNYEIIIVDDGSTDLSVDICDQYALKNKEIRVFHKKNEGLISARRYGLRRAIGDYVIFCDSDDMLENNMLDKLELTVNRTQADLIIYNTNYLINDKKTKAFEGVFKSNSFISKEEVLNKLLLNQSVNGIYLKACRRSILDIGKDYSDFYDFNYGEDLLQTIPMVINANSIYYLDDSLYIYRIKSGMMRKNNLNLFTSYKTINFEIRKLLSNSEIEDFKLKCDFQLLLFTHLSVAQIKYSDKISLKNISIIGSDKFFKQAYKNIRNSEYQKKLTKKQLFILTCLFKNNFFIIRILLHVDKILMQSGLK